MSPAPRQLDQLLDDQHGVVSRRQLVALGLDDSFIRREVRRRRLVRVHRGVYVDHTGQLTWLQRAWAALLYYAPAVLADESALTAEGFRTASDTGVLHVAVGHERRVGRLADVRVHRIVGVERLSRPAASLPRLRAEDALLRVASRLRLSSDAVAVLGDACQSRRTTPGRLLSALERHLRLPRRAFLLEVLADTATGAYSVLEHRYLTQVERPHGLPTAERQRRVLAGRGPAYRDVEYLGHRLVVELDGRLGHEEATDRWADLERDVAGVESGAVTLRMGWRVVDDPCRAAVVVSRMLRARGWRGRPRPCTPGCDVGADRPPGDRSTPLSARGADQAGPTRVVTSSAQPQDRVTPAPPCP